ncbi:type II secretion system GspH family protein [Massilia sp. R798]|uniref:Type II secretion system GspH family protein n=2 Tax=Massilia soli TaxID=2792854 RepID=A0ABS7SKZ6_9BURK|nr:type II secretion system GspH family protein [Massilia soli]
MAARGRSGGFTYIGLVVLLAILGLVAAAGMKTGALMQRAAAEQELLEIGAAFSDALRSYAAATPKGQQQQPPNLDALLKDPRFPGVRRHLRRVFVDPITGKAAWGLVTNGDKTWITGVYSLSDARPLKVGNFDARFVNFDNKERISDWKFTAAGQGLLIAGAPGSPDSPAVPVEPALPAQTQTPAPEPEPSAPPAPAAADAPPIVELAPDEAAEPVPSEPVAPEEKEVDAEDDTTTPVPVAK